jgi:hypothetical protein
LKCAAAKGEVGTPATAEDMMTDATVLNQRGQSVTPRSGRKTTTSAVVAANDI